METRRMIVGRAGEQLAADFLARHGAVIVGRNVTVGRDEIDLLVDIGGRRVAVEVKTGLGGVAPEEHFDAAKQSHLRRAVSQLDPPAARIDLVSVVFGRDGATVRWIPDAG
jgi:putative endonuclease